MYCDVDTRFAPINQQSQPLKRGEGLQIASEPGSFGEGTYTEVRDRDERRRGRKMSPYTAFGSTERKRMPLKRGEELQIAPEPGSFGEGSVHNGT